MLFRIFAVLFVLNLAVQVAQAKADDSMFAWQSGYTESMAQSMLADAEKDGIVARSECIRRAISLVVNRVIFGEQDSGMENFRSRSLTEAVHKTSYAMDFDEDEVHLGVAWAF